ncbi:proline-rich transmembrane protein 1-like isoform X2 [Ptychodera flava]|uniref:proline-rich transmembrane protein 1-like isoform X2 n=1 Tax=Ptychodera flava TaxID=63121 RepID=UPI00396A0B6C
MSEEKERLVGGGGGDQSPPAYAPPVYEATAPPVYQATAPPVYQATAPPVYQAPPLQACIVQVQRHVQCVHVQGEYGRPMQDPPNTYMCLSIFVCLCCFNPFGYGAFIKALDAHYAVLAGDRVTAENSSMEAKNFATASIVCGVFFLIVPAVVALVVIFML